MGHFPEMKTRDPNRVLLTVACVQSPLFGFLRVFTMYYSKNAGVYFWVLVYHRLLIVYSRNCNHFPIILTDRNENGAESSVVAEQKAVKDSANQKLLDLGLTQEEITALLGYAPSE